jgi:hypothetical protein
MKVVEIAFSCYPVTDMPRARSFYEGSRAVASLDNPLCDSLISRGVRHAVFPMKTAIAAQLSKLTGWDAPTKVEVEAGETLSSILGRLFARGGTLGNNGENGERNKETSDSAARR